MRIVAHAPATQRERRLAQLERIDAGHAQVDCFRLNVKAVPGHSGGVSAKGFIRQRGAVAAHDVDLAVGMSD